MPVLTRHILDAGDNYVDPNFPMGTGGIGFALLRLYEESKDEEFLVP